jgi:hypothetical protein
MLPHRRFLLAALLMGLVVGCQRTTETVPSADKTAEQVAKDRMDKKLKQVQEEPEGPKLGP